MAAQFTIHACLIERVGALQKVNQIVIWDRVIESIDDAVIHESHVDPSYPLVDNGQGLRYGLILYRLLQRCNVSGHGSNATYVLTRSSWLADE
jgi:hypothetical protein